MLERQAGDQTITSIDRTNLLQVVSDAKSGNKNSLISLDNYLRPRLVRFFITD